MKNDRDYVLGTHDAEIERLGLQHRVWRSKMLEAFALAGITEGSRVVDFGCGPGYASVDLGEMVGERGAVLGIERSHRFVAHAENECRRRALNQVRFLEADLMNDLSLSNDFDALWCRWVASFVTDLPKLVRQVSSAVRPGGKAIFHEYVDYATWRTLPHSTAVENFVTEVMASWRASGGEPNIAGSLLSALRSAGWEIVDTTPLIFSVSPAHFVWRWPSAFLKSNVKRLVEIGRVSESWARPVEQEFSEIEREENSLMLTPMVLQIVARKSG